MKSFFSVETALNWCLGHPSCKKQGRESDFVGGEEVWGDELRAGNDSDLLQLI